MTTYNLETQKTMTYLNCKKSIVIMKETCSSQYGPTAPNFVIEKDEKCFSCFILNLLIEKDQLISSVKAAMTRFFERYKKSIKHTNILVNRLFRKAVRVCLLKRFKPLTSQTSFSRAKCSIHSPKCL